MGKRRKQELPKKIKDDIFIPLTLKDIGTKKDPCFGKGYDLSVKECKRCGDSELCAIGFAQYMGKTRKQLEQENSYKDLESTIEPGTVKKYMRSMKRKNMKGSEIIKAAQDKYELSRADARSLYKQLK